jgi:hypothetical protein
MQTLIRRFERRKRNFFIYFSFSLLLLGMASAFLGCRRRLPGSYPALWLRSAECIATRSLSSAQNEIIFDNGNILVGKVEGKGMGMLAARRFETGATILEV